MSNLREFDVIVYGASGFTGKLIADYLNQNYSHGGCLRWAMAGRDEARLRSVRSEINAPASTQLVVADIGDPESLRAMASRTKLVLTAVGPYLLYGEPLLAACIETGTDYVDLCGETLWMHQMIHKYEAAARQSGSRVVFSSGFDSIPFDLGVFYLQQAALEHFGSTFPRVKGRVREMNGAYSGGTAASARATMAAVEEDSSVIQVLMNPFSLTPGFTGPEQPPAATPEYDESLGSWLAPFIMAGINTRNIHRSNFLMNHLYGKDFVYDEMILTGPGELGRVAAEAVTEDTPLIGENAPKPGEGPSEEERESGSYDLLFVGELPDGQKLKVSVTGDRDPGYGSTCRMISESAICMVKDVPGLAGGIWTPATAMGQKLIHRLVANAGLTFQIED